MMKYGDLRPGDVICWRALNDEFNFSEVHMIIAVASLRPPAFSRMTYPKGYVNFTLLAMYLDRDHTTVHVNTVFSWPNNCDNDIGDNIVIIKGPN